MATPNTSLAPQRTMIDIGMEIDHICRIIEDPEATPEELATAKAELDSILELDLAEKVDAYAWVDKQIDSGIKEIQEHVAKPADKAVATLKRRKQYLRDRCKNAMDLMHADLIKGRVHTIYLRESGPELHLEDDFTAPPQYCTVTVTMPLSDWQRLIPSLEPAHWQSDPDGVIVSADEQSMKQDLKAGVEIPGARLKDRPDTLVIL